MEIAILPKSSLKIKAKSATFVADPQDATLYNAGLLVGKTDANGANEEMVILDGPGEYEIGGTKMTGVRSEDNVVFSLSVDGVAVALGKVSALEKIHNKLKEHNIAVVLCDEVSSASFVTTLSSNVIIFYGSHASEVAQTFGENVKKMAKYSTTKDKLPQEVETIVLE